MPLLVHHEGSQENLRLDGSHDASEALSDVEAMIKTDRSVPVTRESRGLGAIESRDDMDNFALKHQDIGQDLQEKVRREANWEDGDGGNLGVGLHVSRFRLDFGSRRKTDSQVRMKKLWVAVFFSTR